MAGPQGGASAAAPAAQNAVQTTGPGAANSAANQPGAKPGGQAQPTSAEIRKIKLKLDGKEVELPESEVISYAQQGKVATQRFQEAAKLRAEAEQMMKFAAAKPEEFFKRTGMNAREWAEQFLLAEIQREAMSPEQKRARELEEENQRYKTKEQQEIAEKKRKFEELKTKEFHDSYEKMFVTALNESGLPKTPFTIARMAKLQQLNLKNGYELSASQLAKLVREDYNAELKSVTGGLDGDQLLEWLGPELVKKLSKAQIAKLKARANPAQSSANTNQGPAAKNKNDEPGLTWAQLQKRNRRPY